MDNFNKNIAECNEHLNSIASITGITCSSEKETDVYNQINSELVKRNIALTVMLDTAQRELACARATIAEIKASLENINKRLRGEI